MRGVSFQIRQADLSDVESIVSLALQLGYPTTSEAMKSRLERLRENVDHVILVAELTSHEVVGWVHVSSRVSFLDEPIAEIGGLVVDQNHRRRGIGRKLIQAAERWARSKGYSKVVVRSNVVRPEAHEFYPSVGYQLSKTSRVYTKNIGC